MIVWALFVQPRATSSQGLDANATRSPPLLLWELKRTKTWSDGWLPKLREDQRRCGADVALIISQALPKHIEHFDLVDNVWVAHPRCALPVAVALWQSLIELSRSQSDFSVSSRSSDKGRLIGRKNSSHRPWRHDHT